MNTQRNRHVTQDNPFQSFGLLALYVRVLSGEHIVYERDGEEIACLYLEARHVEFGKEVAPFFVMQGITGVHRLNAHAWATDAERLHTHWQGFMANARDKHLS